MKNIVIKLNQDKDILKERWKGALDKEELDFRLKYIAKDIVVDNVYECFKVVDGTILDSYNISITEITQNDNDYIIKGVGEEDELIELNFSQTEFWTC